MTDSDIKIHHWLLPFSWLYGIGVGLRNKLFDRGMLRSKSFAVPTICIGNLSVGGTGKTPHTEYLIRLLQAQGLQVATLSRGYKRKSKGYRLADEQSSAALIGDEPFQMKQKFPNACVAVDEDRCHGIGQLLQLAQPAVDVVLLDDAFQHRYVKAHLNILLTDYNRLFCDDALLPAGRLREPAAGKNRAQMVVVTKCPDNIKPIDFTIVEKKLNLYPYQQLYFSRLRYGKPTPLFPEASQQPLPDLRRCEVLLVTGIASPAPLKKEMERQAKQVELHEFGDHHDFTSKELALIEQRFLKLPEGQRLVITTEKDAARLRSHPGLPEHLKSYIYVIPIEIEILQNKQDSFNQNIIGYVRTNSRDRRIS